MKKTGAFLLIMIVMIFCTGADMAELDRFSENGFSFSDTVKTVTEGGRAVDIENLFESIKDELTKEIGNAFTSLGAVMGTVFLFSLINSMQHGFGRKGVHEISFFVVYSVVCTILLRNFSVVSETVTSLIENVVLFSNAAIPVIGTSVAASGNFGIYSSMYPLLIGVSALSANIIKSVGVPALMLSLSLGVVGNISENFSLSGIGKTIRNGALWMITGLLTLFSAAIAICGMSAPSVNGVFLRGAKFVARSTIPVLGGLLSDSVETVIMGGMMLKNAVGTAVVVGVIIMLLYPLIKVAAVIFAYKLTASVASPFCDKRIMNVIGDISGTLSCLVGFAVAECVTVIVSITSLINASITGVMLR